MSTKLAAAALLAALVPAASMADSVALTVPNYPTRLSTDGVDMSIQFTDGAAGAYEVVATYITDAEPNQPKRLVMELQDGDDVVFALPDHLQTLYNFQRSGSILTVSGEEVAVVERANS